MNRLATLWRRLAGLKMALLAGLMTGAEGLVAMGIELPGSSWIPVQHRALAIFALTVGAFIMRHLAAREGGKRGQ